MERESPDAANPTFAPIRRERVFEQVARQIRRQIVEGKLEPGDQLPPERELASQFGVSRVSARQALTLLMAEGLIENRVGKGTFLRTDTDGFTITNLASSVLPERERQFEMQVRELIEPGAARLAASAAHRRLDELEQIVDRQVRALPDPQLFSVEDSAFHIGVAKLTGNPLLVRIIEILHTMIEPTRVESLASEDGRRQSLAGHQRILQAIRDGDADAAEQAMSDHLATVKTLLRRSGPSPLSPLPADVDRD